MAVIYVRESAVLDYLRRQAEDRLIAHLPTPQLRVMAALTPPNPPPGLSYAPPDWREFPA